MPQQERTFEEFLELLASSASGDGPLAADQPTAATATQTPRPITPQADPRQGVLLSPGGGPIFQGQQYDPAAAQAPDTASAQVPSGAAQLPAAQPEPQPAAAAVPVQPSPTVAPDRLDEMRGLLAQMEKDAREREATVVDIAQQGFASQARTAESQAAVVKQLAADFNKRADAIEKRYAPKRRTRGQRRLELVGRILETAHQTYREGKGQRPLSSYYSQLDRERREEADRYRTWGRNQAARLRDQATTQQQQALFQKLHAQSLRDSAKSQGALAAIIRKTGGAEAKVKAELGAAKYGDLLGRGEARTERLGLERRRVAASEASGARAQAGAERAATKAEKDEARRETRERRQAEKDQRQKLEKRIELKEKELGLLDPGEEKDAVIAEFDALEAQLAALLEGGGPSPQAGGDYEARLATFEAEQGRSATEDERAQLRAWIEGGGR